MPTLYPCLCCLNANACELKADVKGRPYTVCRVCGTRSFMHSQIALRGLTHFAPQLIALWRQQTAGAFLTELDRAIEAARNGAAVPTAAVG